MEGREFHNIKHLPSLGRRNTNYFRPALRLLLEFAVGCGKTAGRSQNGLRELRKWLTSFLTSITDPNCHNAWTTASALWAPEESSTMRICPPTRRLGSESSASLTGIGSKRNVLPKNMELRKSMPVSKSYCVIRRWRSLT